MKNTTWALLSLQDLSFSVFNDFIRIQIELIKFKILDTDMVYLITFMKVKEHSSH